ncbi:MAG TPA: hypothetical protein VGD59_06635 [Acidisarcina sp.]
MEDEIAAGGVTHSRGPRPAAYLWLLILVPLLAYLAVFAIVRVPAFNYERWGTSRYGSVLEYAFHADHQDADIVILGDSSAFIGIDPRLVNAQLGVKSILLPNTVGTLPLTGEISLERYLARNKPPRLIVLYLTAWDLNYEHTPNPFLFDGDEMMLRHGTARELGAAVKQYPVDFLVFPFRLSSTIGARKLLRILSGPDRVEQVTKALGHADYPEGTVPMKGTCTIPAHYLWDEGDSTVSRLINKFTNSQTQVILYLSPVPDCTNASALSRAAYAQLGAAPPATLPVTMFVSDEGYAHLEPSGVPAATQLFIDAVRHRATPLLSSGSSH